MLAILAYLSIQCFTWLGMNKGITFGNSRFIWCLGRSGSRWSEGCWWLELPCTTISRRGHSRSVGSDVLLFRSNILVELIRYDICTFETSVETSGPFLDGSSFPQNFKYKRSCLWAAQELGNLLKLVLQANGQNASSRMVRQASFGRVFWGGAELGAAMKTQRSIRDVELVGWQWLVNWSSATSWFDGCWQSSHFFSMSWQNIVISAG